MSIAPRALHPLQDLLSSCDGRSKVTAASCLSSCSPWRKPVWHVMSVYSTSIMRHASTECIDLESCTSSKVARSGVCHVRRVTERQRLQRRAAAAFHVTGSSADEERRHSMGHALASVS